MGVNLAAADVFADHVSRQQGDTAVLGETLTVMSLAGFATTAGAVWLCTRSR